MVVRIQSKDFDTGRELDKLTDGFTEIGGLVSFTGLVRDIGSKHAVQSMTLEHYPGMTEKLLREIETEALNRWPLSTSLIIHRFGKLFPGDKIVLVATASEHRQAAFEACEFLIDWLKTKAPFWKLEESSDGAAWVKARESDDDSALRWNRHGN